MWLRYPAILLYIYLHVCLYGVCKDWSNFNEHSALQYNQGRPSLPGDSNLKSVMTKETRLFPPHCSHKYLSSEVDSSSLIHFHACTYLVWIPVKNNYNDPPRISTPPSLLRGVCCQDCLHDFPESGCPHLCLISTTIRPSTPNLMRRHLQPRLEDPTDKDAIQPLHKCFPPDTLGWNFPPPQNRKEKKKLKIWDKWWFLHPEKWVFVHKNVTWKIKWGWMWNKKYMKTTNKIRGETRLYNLLPLICSFK